MEANIKQKPETNLRISVNNEAICSDRDYDSEKTTKKM